MSQMMNLRLIFKFAFSLFFIGLTISLSAHPSNDKPLEEQAKPHHQTRQVQLQSHKVIGDKRLVFSQGDNIRLLIESDKTLELHIHGYDIKKNLQANQPLVIEFEATNSGRFSVTSHGSPKEKALLHNEHIALFYLEIYPQ